MLLASVCRHCLGWRSHLSGHGLGTRGRLLGEREEGYYLENFCNEDYDQTDPNDAQSRPYQVEQSSGVECSDVEPCPDGLVATFQEYGSDQEENPAYYRSNND